MTAPTTTRSNPPAPPTIDDRALVFTVRNDPSVNAFIDEKVKCQHRYNGTNGKSSDTLPGLEWVDDYVGTRGEGTCVRPLYPERAWRTVGTRNRMFALPPDSPKGDPVAGLHYVRVASPDHLAPMVRALKSDPRVQDVEQPRIHYPIIPNLTGFGPEKEALWGLELCGFQQFWNIPDSPEDKPIGVIDQGTDNGNLLLQGRITIKGAKERHVVSLNDHASEVASVIAARRGIDNVYGMAGCCSAKIDLYNVWTTGDKFDSGAYYDALKQVAVDGLPVVNLSLGSTDRDPTAEKLIRDASAQGVVFVAAVGNEAGSGSPTYYPAAYDDVIGVGATTVEDRKLPSSSTGNHVFISAPGWRILAVYGDSACRAQSGTSYAAAMVSAAVWLLKRKIPDLTLKEVKDRLQLAVDGVSVPGGRRNSDLGFGRLDVTKLLA